MALQFPITTPTLADNAETDAHARAGEILATVREHPAMASHLLVIALMQWYDRGKQDTLHPEGRRIR